MNLTELQAQNSAALLDGNENNIWCAAADGKLDLIRAYIEELGINAVDVPDSNGYTPLMAAVSYGQSAVYNYLLSITHDNNVIAVDLMRKDQAGNNILHYIDDPSILLEFLSDRLSIEQTIHMLKQSNEDNLTPIESYLEDENAELVEIALKFIRDNAINDDLELNEIVQKVRAEMELNEEIWSTVLQALQQQQQENSNEDITENFNQDSDGPVR